MKGARDGTGQGAFHPNPDSDETLLNGFHEFLGNPDWDCELKMTPSGEFYLHQWYYGVVPVPPEPKGLEEALARAAARREADCQSIVRTEQLSRAEAVQWILDNFLPEEFEDNVRIVCEEAES